MEIKETNVKNHKKTILSGKDTEIYNALVAFDKALRNGIKESIESVVMILKKKLGVNISIKRNNGQIVIEMNGWHKNKIKT